MKKKRPKPSSYRTLFPPEPSLNSLPSSKADFSRLIAVVSIAAAVALACNFITASLNQPPKPFCDTTDDLNDPLSEYCQPCPTNGVCYDGKLTCDQGFRKQGNLCVEDGDISRAAKKLSQWVEDRVCGAYAQLLCSGTGKCWIEVDELLDNLDRMSDNRNLDKAIYMPTKQKAMETIRSALETRRDNQGVEELKCPELLVDNYKPLSCVVRQWIIKHALLLVPACALIVGCILIACRAYQRHLLSVRAEQLYHEVCDILEEKPLVSKNGSGEGEPWVVASSLRDHLLLPKERKDPFLWRKVEELVQEDSRVDQYPKLVKGESKVVWEWQVEGSVGSSGKRKKNAGSAKESMNSSANVLRRMHAA
ncbi:uncharacterized protein LOC131024720 isoform X2 [Salvia miltiorrhiza]|uniref:uncharacterized protein LOC131024720 isoform X2 n=1 Tax=Salvia miltiorrhiza TaxID=226208 RepID=UPI0025AD6A48|nr:uncharacterized protein LOC131024720 isoform X2 [Salvia miltiorrhiza]